MSLLSASVLLLESDVSGAFEISGVYDRLHAVIDNNRIKMYLIYNFTPYIVFW